MSGGARSLLTALTLTASLGLAVGVVAPAAAQMTIQIEPNSVLLRTAIVVKDIERSKRFYSRALGYEIGFDGDITRPGVIEQLRLKPGQRAHFTVLKSSNVIGDRKYDGAMIGLLQISNPAPPVMRRPRRAEIAVGEAMLAIQTRDIRQVTARLRELGATFLVEPMDSPDGKETELVVYDPDGIRIHVLERREAAAAKQ